MLPFAEGYFKVLERLHTDMEQAIDRLPQAALDWSPGPDINSIVVLIAHVAGSERYWLGDVIARSPSNRDREAEFHTRGLDETALKNRLAASTIYARSVLEQLTLDDLETTRMLPSDSSERSVAWVLAHVLEHVGTHLGHIQLTRQFWELKQDND